MLAGCPFAIQTLPTPHVGRAPNPFPHGYPDANGRASGPVPGYALAFGHRRDRTAQPTGSNDHAPRSRISAMTGHLFLFAGLAGLFGGFMNGFAGTGTALFGLGFALVALEPPQAVLVIALLSSLVGLQGLWVVRDAIPRAKGRMILFILPGLAGIPLGLWSLQFVSGEALRLLVALLLITFGGYFSFRKALPSLPRDMALADGTVGFLSGVLGGLASLSGTLPVIWFAMRDWPKAQIRAVMQGFNVVILSLTALALTLSGAFTREALLALAVALPAGALAAQLGIFLFRRLTEPQFRRALIVLCFVMGLVILAGVAL